MKKITAAMLIITAAFFLGLGGFTKTLMADTSENEKENRDVYLNIMTVTKPEYEMVKELAKDKHNIQYMFNNSKDIKDYKYDKSVLKNISNMDLFFYSAGTKDYEKIDSMINELDKSTLGVVNLSRGIRELRYKEDDKEVPNPYFYLGVNEYKIMLYNTKGALQEKDPANREYYEKNYEEIVKSLDKFDDFLNDNSKELKKYTFIVKDGSFDYFFKSLGVNYKELPKGQSLDKFLKEKDLDSKDVVFVEDLNGDEEDIKDIKVVKLEKFDDDKSFGEMIKSNIDKLKKEIL